MGRARLLCQHEQRISELKLMISLRLNRFANPLFARVGSARARESEENISQRLPILPPIRLRLETTLSATNEKSARRGTEIRALTADKKLAQNLMNGFPIHTCMHRGEAMALGVG